VIKRKIPILLAASLLVSCKAVETRDREQASNATSLRQLQHEARRFNSVIREPRIEKTPAEIQQSVSNTIVQVNGTLAIMEKRDSRQATFENTAKILDDLSWELSCTRNRLWLISETSTNKVLCESAVAGMKRLPAPPLGGEAACAVVESFAAGHPRLSDQDARLLGHIEQDYRRAGFNLPKADCDKIMKMRQRLAGLLSDFDNP
jgi:Zn-dependent oligopeptidase